MFIENPNEQSSVSQRINILTDLLKGVELTSLSMLQRFGAMDGRKRISELRRQGYDIKSRRGYNEKTKKHFNIYYMEPETAIG